MKLRGAVILGKKADLASLTSSCASCVLRSAIVNAVVASDGKIEAAQLSSALGVGGQVSAVQQVVAINEVSLAGSGGGGGSGNGPLMGGILGDGSGAAIGAATSRSVVGGLVGGGGSIPLKMLNRV